MAFRFCRHSMHSVRSSSAFMVLLSITTLTPIFISFSALYATAYAQYSRTTLLSDTDLTVSGGSQPPALRDSNDEFLNRALDDDRQQQQNQLRRGSSLAELAERRPAAAASGSRPAEDAAVAVNRACVHIEIPMCKHPLIEYNTTMMPNLLGHAEQKEAGYEAHSWLPLISLNCSNYLRIFLCSVYVPMCTPMLDHTLRPCRSLCEAAREDCFPIMQKFGNMPWPERMLCENFPTRAKDDLCFGPEIDMHRPRNFNGFSGGQLLGNTADDVYSTTPSPVLKPTPPRSASSVGTGDYSPDASGALEYQFVCPLSLQRSGHSVWIDGDSRSNNRNVVENCGFPCGRPELAYYYAAQPPVVAATTEGVTSTSQFPQQHLRWGETRNIIGITAMVCCVGCVLAVLTFLLDTNRFHYPERPMLYIVFCYALISGVYVFGYWQGGDSNDVVCDLSINDRVVSVPGGTAATTFAENVTFSRLPTIVQGTDKSACVFSFVVYYFAWLASLLWWLMLSITWFLSATLKWGTESIHNKTAFFHFIAWGVPGLGMAVVLAMGRIEGDPVAGFCMVGGVLSPSIQVVFVIVPLLVALAVGVFLLVCGFISISRVRAMIKATQTPNGSIGGGPPTEFTRQSLAIMEKLMWRIGLFACAFSGANGMHAAMLIYEQLHRHRFMLAWRSRTCQLLGVPCPSLQHYATNGTPLIVTTEPGLWLPTVRHLAVLAVGVASCALLLLTFKTCRVWWCKCVCCCCRRRHNDNNTKGGGDNASTRRSAVGSNASSSLMHTTAAARHGFHHQQQQQQQLQRHAHGGGANLALLNGSNNNGHVSAMTTPQLAMAAFHQHSSNNNGYAGSHLLASHSDNGNNGSVAIGLRSRGGYGSEHMEPTQV